MLLSENGKYPKERTPEIEKKIWFHDMFFHIYHTYREKILSEKMETIQKYKKKFREIEVNVYVCCKINFHTYTQTHTVAFFGSDQNNNPKNVINDGLVYVSFPTSVRRIHL